jgi:hypothetical protein
MLTPSGKIKRVGVNNSGVDIKIVERSARQYYSKIVFKVLFDAEGGIQDDIFWDDSKPSGEVASSSENESMTEGSLAELSD